MILIRYNVKKALANLGMIFIGVLLVKTAPCFANNDFTGCDTWAFWKHVFWLAGVTTGVAELKYIYAWLATINGNNKEILKNDGEFHAN